MLISNVGKLPNQYLIMPALDVDFRQANMFYKSLTSNSPLTLSNPQNGLVVVLAVYNSGASPITLTFPAAKWYIGTPQVTVASNNMNLYTISYVANTYYISAVTDMR